MRLRKKYRYERLNALPTKAILLLVLSCALYSGEAQAYFDPASGSVLVQLLVGLVVGIAVTAKLWFTKAKLFFLRLLGKSSSAMESEDEQVHSSRTP